VKGVILAAGIASRLRPLTDTVPKCLLDVGGKTILGRALEGLSANGIADIVIVTGYREQQIRDFVETRYPHLDVTFLWNEHFASTNNIYSLWMTRNEFRDTEMLLMDSDIVFDPPVIGLLTGSGYANCLAIASGVALGDEEIKVRVDETGAIAEISKEVSPAKALGESIGIEKFGAVFLEHLFPVLDRMIGQEGKVNLFYEAAFQEVIEGGQRLFPVDVGALHSLEIDTAEDLDRARALIAFRERTYRGN
jgi:choline kinase